MAKKKRNLKPDIILKNYWRDNERFADLFNAVLFGGEQVIQPDELEDLDAESSTILEHRKYAEGIAASRDNIKVRKKSTAYGIELVMLGNESQEHIDYAMPMRVMGYDYSAYKKQFDSNAMKYKDADGMGEDEYLSRMKRTDRFLPVITVTVYYGRKPWDGATSLHGMLDIPEELKRHVNDHRMLLVEARKNNLVLHDMNNVDLFNLLEILLDGSRPAGEIRSRAIGYTKERQVDKTVIMTAAGAVDNKIDYNALEQKGDVDMYTVFEETRVEGRKEGRAEEIIETGYEFGLSDEDILGRLQRKLDISLEMARAYLREFGKQTV